MKQKLFLVRLMGAGKSTVEKQLAPRLKMDLYDSNRVIIDRTGVPIATIFEIEGEEGFRDRKTRALEEFSRNEDCVIATGGVSLHQDFKTKQACFDK